MAVDNIPSKFTSTNTPFSSLPLRSLAGHASKIFHDQSHQTLANPFIAHKALTNIAAVKADNVNKTAPVRGAKTF